MTSIHKENSKAEEEEENKEGEEEEEEDKPKKKSTNSFKQKMSLKKKNSTGYSMNSIKVSNIKEEDMLTYLKMKKLKDLFNVCRALCLINSLLRNHQKTDLQFRQ